MSMEELDRAQLLAAASKFPVPPGLKFSYGTAGYRSEASLLPSTVFRTGVLAALRSLCTQAATGVMVTASHNPIEDNGVKVVDPRGEMLVQDWEPLADALVNAQGSEMLLKVVEDIMEKKSANCKGFTFGKVLLAKDTRPSGESLLYIAKQGVEAVSGVVAILSGTLTTPQLHWMVCAVNRGVAFGESEYLLQLSDGFRLLLELKPTQLNDCTSPTYYERLIVDGSHGVGASKLFQLQKSITDLQLEIRNCPQDGVLNDHVGADFVQKGRTGPHGFDCIKDSGRRCVSFDGDADRLVYFYFSRIDGMDKHIMHLLDGDKIMALFALFLMQQFRDLCLFDATMKEQNKQSMASCNEYFVDGYGPVRFGLVQTAYANGSSTMYLREELGLNVVLTPTGVKYLHAKAAEYDVGVYFEANGHGTVLINEAFLLWLRSEYASNKDGNATSDKEGCKTLQCQAGQRLLAISEIMNQAVGDALSGLLLVEVILRYMNWSIQDWDAIYTDLPSRQLKVQVLDRASIKTVNAETRVTIPLGLQDAIDAEVGKIPGGRAFVRPSGTEDVVRVYAEAATQDGADILAHAVAVHVYQLGGGVGESQ
eukprot:c28675_g1_i2 orf=97-1878(+)